MSLLACQPLYSVVASKKGLILGGVSSASDVAPLGSILKLDFETESVLDTTRALSTKRAFLASVGFADSVTTAGGDIFGMPTSTLDRYNLTTETTESVTQALSLPRTYLSSASNLAIGLFIGGQFGRPYGVVEQFTKADNTLVPSNHLARSRAGQTTTSNSYEALTVGYNEQVESYNFSTRSIYTKFSSNLKLVGQHSASSTDIAMFGGGQLDFPLAYQYKIRFSDSVEVPAANLSVSRVGASALSNTSIAYVAGGTATNGVDTFNFFDSTSYVSFNFSYQRYFSGYASSCHGGTVQ